MIGLPPDLYFGKSGEAAVVDVVAAAIAGIVGEQQWPGGGFAPDECGAGPGHVYRAETGDRGPMCRQLSAQEGVLFSECRWRSVYVRLRIPDSSSPPPM